MLSFCGLNKENKRGITLIALVITITVLIILASVATYSGAGVIRQAKLNSFTTEMKMMQSEVNALYDRYTSGETEVLSLGKDLDSQADKVFTSSASGITDKTGYRYYDQETIKGLGIEGVESEYFVNVEKRSVVSYDGFEYNGVTYYTLGEVPNGEYNVEYEKNTNKPTFDVSVKKQEDGTYRMTISNVQYDGYINKWQVKYKRDGQDYWSTSEDLSFIVPDKGEYDVKLINGEIESNIVEYTPTLVKKWTSKIDGNGEEEFLDVERTSDGGYIAVGYTTSTDISGLTNKGGEDALIVKYDANGNEQWKKSVGGSRNDRYSGVIEITNGTYIAVGTIYSTDVLDKNGKNIGHGYDFKFQVIPSEYSSVSASEGIIGKYDSNGNEISLNVTGIATDKYTTEQYWAEGGFQYEGFDYSEYSVANIIIEGIDKTSDGSYIITGQKEVAVPSSFADMDTRNGNLAIKYDKNGNQIAISFRLYKYAGSWYGAREKSNGDYLIYGERTGVMGESIQTLNTEFNKIDGSTVYPPIRQLLLYENDDYISISGTDTEEFISLQKSSTQGSWQKKTEDIGNRTIKQISKSSESDFVGICEKDGNSTLAKFSVEDGNILNEYNMPSYNNVYAIEGEDEYIFLGTPTNEEGITITGTSGAVIAKYSIE